jgi:hypothetical protein
MMVNQGEAGFYARILPVHFSLRRLIWRQAPAPSDVGELKNQSPPLMRGFWLLRELRGLQAASSTRQ